MKQKTLHAANKPASDYMNFRCNFQASNLQSIRTGRTYTKGEFWDKFRSLAMRASKDGICPVDFRLVDNPLYGLNKSLS